MAILADELSDLREYMHSNGVMFCFTGFMTEDVLTGVGSALKKKLEVEDVDRKSMKGLFSVFVELVQNVIRYSAEGAPSDEPSDMYDLRYGVVTVGRDQDRYFVACGNLISEEDEKRLSKDLAYIASLDSDGLKQVYKATLKGDAPEGSKGAGVGFIEIARRATYGFEFDFKKIKDGRSFFSLKAYL
jgi:hypothetical protein